MQQPLKTIWVSYHHIIDDDDAKISQDYDILYIYDCYKKSVYMTWKKRVQNTIYIFYYIFVYTLGSIKVNVSCISNFIASPFYSSYHVLGLVSVESGHR